TQSLFFAVAQWYAWAALVPAVVVAGRRFDFFAAPIARRIGQHLVFAFVFAFAHLFLQTSAVWLLVPGGRAFLGRFDTGLASLLATTLHWELLSYALVLAVTQIALYLRRSQLDAIARRELETRAAQAQLAALRRQMQPHFLFNALNALVSMLPEA